jgi:hypothetical protein
MKMILLLFIFFNCSLFAQDIPCYKTFFEDRLISFNPEMEQSAPTTLLVKQYNFIATQNFEIDLSFVKKIEHVGKVFDHKKYVSEYGGLCVPSTSAGQMLDVLDIYLVNDLFFDKLLKGKATRFTFYPSRRN